MGDAAQEFGVPVHVTSSSPASHPHRMAKLNDCSNHTLLIPNAGFQHQSQQRRPGDKFHISLTDGASAVNAQCGAVTSAKLQCLCLLCTFSEKKCKALVATAASSENFEAVKVLL